MDSRALQAMVRTARGASRSPLSSDFPFNVESKLDHLVEGRWSATDVIELAMDEVATTANVGVGLAQGLGHSDSVKLRKRYKEYLSKVQKEVSTSTAKNFLDEVIPGLDESQLESLLAALTQ